MLESCINQGAGLQHMASQRSPRLLAMASHGNQQGELPLLWSVSTALVDMGYSVLVLDAHTTESPNNPGLQQILEGSCWARELISESDAWSVMPAAQGLDQLSEQAAHNHPPLEALAEVLNHVGVIVLYARAELLARVLAGSGVEPLLSVSPLKMSSVTAYQALKQMLLNAGLRSTVAQIAMGPVTVENKQNPSAMNKLQGCAMAFLGCQVDALTIRAGQSEDKIADDIHRLTRRLLEKSVPLRRIVAEGSH